MLAILTRVSLQLLIVTLVCYLFVYIMYTHYNVLCTMEEVILVQQDSFFMAFKGSIMFNFGSEIIIKIIKKDVYIWAVVPLRQLKHSAESILRAFTLSWFGIMHLE